MQHPDVPKAAKATTASDEDLRARLVRVAAELVDAEGARAATLRAVGEAAGVSRTAPYLHFADREALLAAVAEEGLAALHKKLHTASRREKGPFAQLRALAAAYVEYAAHHPHRFRLMFGPEVGDRKRHAGLEREGRAIETLLSSSLGTAAAMTPHASAEARLASLTAWSVVHGLAHLIVDGRAADLGFATASPRALAERVADLLTRAVTGMHAAPQQRPASRRKFSSQ